MAEEVEEYEPIEGADLNLDQRHNRMKYFYEFGGVVVVLAVLVAVGVWFTSNYQIQKRTGLVPKESSVTEVINDEQPNTPSESPRRYPTLSPAVEVRLYAQIRLQHQDGALVLLDERNDGSRYIESNIGNDLYTIIRHTFDTDRYLYYWSNDHILYQFDKETNILREVAIPDEGRDDLFLANLHPVDATTAYLVAMFEHEHNVPYYLNESTLELTRVDGLEGCKGVYCFGPELVDVIGTTFVMQSSGGDGCGGSGYYLTYDTVTHATNRITDFGSGCVDNMPELLGYREGYLYLADREFDFNGSLYSRVWKVNVMTEETERINGYAVFSELPGKMGMSDDGELYWHDYRSCKFVYDGRTFVETSFETVQEIPDAEKNEALLDEIQALYGEQLVIEWDRSVR